MPQAIILDMYDSHPNRGMAAIQAALVTAGCHDVAIIDVRAGQPIPPITAAPLWVSSGGPGDPADCGTWGAAYGAWLDALIAHNQQNPQTPIKAWLICHSFQVASVHWQLGMPRARPQGLLKGIYPQQDSEGQITAQTWESRYYGIYDWQQTNFKTKNLKILSCDNSQNALTAWTSLDGAIIATQYHPEVSPEAADQIIAEEGLPVAESKLLEPTYQAFTRFLCGAKVATF